MNLKDPFNRLSGKQQREYLAFQQHLQQAGIDNEEKARDLLLKSRNRMLGYCLAVVVISLGVIVVSPQVMGPAAVLGSLILFWLVITMARGQRLLRQYIEQEFSPAKTQA